MCTDFQNEVDDEVLSWQHMQAHAIFKRLLTGSQATCNMGEECGLGCPFTSESINAMLKCKVNEVSSQHSLTK